MSNDTIAGDGNPYQIDTGSQDLTPTAVNSTVVESSQDLPITTQQIKTIKMAQRAVGIDDDTYREMLHNRYAVESCTRLTREQATDLIQHLKAAGFKVKKRRGHASKDGLVAVATPKQRLYIEHLVRDIPWRAEDGYARWLAERMGFARIRTKEEATKVIEGLKAMRSRAMRSRGHE